MKRTPQLALTALVAALAATSGSAQSVGAACGCPPVSSRTVVTLDPTNAPTVVAANGGMVTGFTVRGCEQGHRVLSARRALRSRV